MKDNNSLKAVLLKRKLEITHHLVFVDSDIFDSSLHIWCCSHFKVSCFSSAVLWLMFEIDARDFPSCLCVCRSSISVFLPADVYDPSFV